MPSHNSEESLSVERKTHNRAATIQTAIRDCFADGKPMLKKTTFKRSPGGTPQRCRSPKPDLLDGLRKRFREVRKAHGNDSDNEDHQSDFDEVPSPTVKPSHRPPLPIPLRQMHNRLQTAPATQRLPPPPPVPPCLPHPITLPPPPKPRTLPAPPIPIQDKSLATFKSPTSNKVKEMANRLKSSLIFKPSEE